jgi:hypothetical protein
MKNQKKPVNNVPLAKPSGIGAGTAAITAIGAGSKLQKSGIGRGIGGGISSMTNTMYSNNMGG